MGGSWVTSQVTTLRSGGGMGVDCRHLPWSLHHCGVFLGPEMPSGLGGGIGSHTTGKSGTGVLDPSSLLQEEGVTSRGRQLVTALGFHKHSTLPHTGQVWDSCGPVIRWVCWGRVESVIGDTTPQAWSPRPRCWGPAPRVGSVVSQSQVSPCPSLSLPSPCLLPHENCTPSPPLCTSQ